MTNLRAATFEAVYKALDVTAVTDLAAVYQHVPEQVQPPCVLIRGIAFEDEGSKGFTLYRATVTIEAYYRGTKGTDAAALADAVEQTIRAGFSSTAVKADIPEVTVEGGEQGDDGVTYETTLTVSALVVPL